MAAGSSRPECMAGAPPPASNPPPLPQVIAIAREFNVDAQIVGRVEAAPAGQGGDD